MGVKEGLLALLDTGPGHCYQLKTSFEEVTGDAWRLNVGQVYTTLERLERDGLIDSVEPSGEAAKRTFVLTEDGRSALGAWWEGSGTDDPPPRDELVLKVLFAVEHGTVKWAENAAVAYMPQDHGAAFEEPVTVFEWMRARGKPRDDDQAIRATLGRLLFSRDEMQRTVDKLSGGERGRMLFGEIMLKRPNIILMDEPTNHLDMESIEALNRALENYPGTLIFVSHYREFVSSLATRIVEIKATGVIDFRGTYDDYLRSRGIAIDLKRAASQ